MSIYFRSALLQIFVNFGKWTLTKSDHHALTTVTFGDRPDGAVVTTALHKTAQMSSDCLRSATLVVSNSFVDDPPISVNDYAEVSTLIQEVYGTLLKWGFKIKKWVISGRREFSDFYPSTVNLDDKVLGVRWHPPSNLVYFKVYFIFFFKES